MKESKSTYTWLGWFRGARGITHVKDGKGVVNYCANLIRQVSDFESLIEGDQIVLSLRTNFGRSPGNNEPTTTVQSCTATVGYIETRLSHNLRGAVLRLRAALAKWSTLIQLNFLTLGKVCWSPLQPFIGRAITAVCATESDMPSL